MHSLEDYGTTANLEQKSSQVCRIFLSALTMHSLVLTLLFFNA